MNELRMVVFGRAARPARPQSRTGIGHAGRVPLLVCVGLVLATVLSVWAEPGVTIEFVRGRTATVVFSGLDATATNSLVLAWGGSDAAGETPADWPNTHFGGLVRPGETRRAVWLPETVTNNLRAFLVSGAGGAPSAYVTNGLINQWDGIDNAGTGAHVATTNVWKDKAGTLDFLLTTNAAWNAAGNGLTVEGLSATGRVATAAYKTIEILFKRRQGASGNFVFLSGCASAGNVPSPRAVVNSGAMVQFETDTYQPVLPIVPDQVFAGAATYADNVLELVYQDGLQARRPVVVSESWQSGVLVASLGGRVDIAGYAWRGGEIYTIRLYNRVLSAAEIAANHRLDAVRFLGVASGGTVLAASSVCACTKAVSIVGTGADLDGKPTTVTLAFRGLGAPCDLAMAWGGADAGMDPASWANRLDLGVVEPDEETRTVALPEGWGTTATHARFFLKTGLDAPTDYVLDALVTWLDGIDNAGTGAHDSDATVWKDKAGALDFTLTNNASFNATEHALYVRGISAIATNGTSAYRTIEGVYRPIRSTGRVIFYSHCKPENVWECTRMLVDGTAMELTYFGAEMNQPIKPLVLPYDPTRIRAVAGVYGTDHRIASVYAEGESVTTANYYNNWGYGTAGATIGGRPHQNVYGWYGYVYALRLHSRALTAAELRANHRLDLVRFRGAARGTDVAAVSPDLTYATGTGGRPDAETSETVATKADQRVDLRTGVRVVEWRRELLPFTYTTNGVTDFTSGYVQSGLLNWWDGIDNAGLGAHNPTASVWKDKAGTLDLYRVGGGTWNATANGLAVNGLAATGRVATAAYRTIEIAFKMTASGRILFASGNQTDNVNNRSHRFVLFDSVGGDIGWECYFDGAKTALYLPWQLDTTAFRTMTGVYNDTSTLTHVYGDGVEDTSGKTQFNDWGNGGRDVVTIGNRADQNGGYNWHGEVYAIRLYDRELTSAEIARNHALDLYRFTGTGASPSDAFTARISVVRVTGTDEDVSQWTEEVDGTRRTLAESASDGEVAWFAKRGVWRVTLELLFGSEKYLFHTETKVFDLRNLEGDGTKIIFR